MFILKWVKTPQFNPIIQHNYPIPEHLLFSSTTLCISFLCQCCTHKQEPVWGERVMQSMKLVHDSYTEVRGNSAVCQSVGLSWWNCLLPLTAAVFEDKLNTSVCVADKLMLSGGWTVALTHNFLSQRKTTWRMVISSFKMTTYLCSSVGLEVISRNAIMNTVRVQVCYMDFD